jgi:tRNA-dihydrouridine synthase
MRLWTLMQTYFEGVRALRRFKRYAVYLAANFAFGNSLYNRLRNAEDFSETAQILEAFFAGRPTQLQRPNLMFMR